MMTSLDRLLSKLDKVKKIGNDRYKAICPAHDDKTPSLAIKYADEKLLLHCFGGCDTADVLSSIGLTFSDLMPEKAMGHFKKDTKPFNAIEILEIIKFEATLTYIYASDMAKGMILTATDRERLLVTVARINHAYEVAKNGL